jgi:hypothetical protein
MEIMPVSMVGKIKPLRLGGMRMFVGAGAGYYLIRTKDDNGGLSSTDTLHKFGREYTAGFENNHGWILELRYRDVDDTDIRGYALALGGKF